MRISDVAKQVGIPVSTIRYYEKRAIIPEPNRNGRNRSYSAKDVSKIQFVRDAQSLGLPLDEISTLIRNSLSKTEIAKVVEGYRAAVRTKIETLQKVDDILSELGTCSCTNVTDCDLIHKERTRDD